MRDKDENRIYYKVFATEAEKKLRATFSISNYIARKLSESFWGDSLPTYKIRVLIRDIDDDREWQDKGVDTAEIVGIMSTDSGSKEDVAVTIMRSLNETVNDGTG